MPSQFFNIDNIPVDIISCVYRLWYRDRYVIAKGKTLAGSVFLIQKGLAYYLAGGGKASENSGQGIAGEGHKLGEGKNSFYGPLYEHIRRHPSGEWKVELVFESDNPYQLLKREHVELEAAYSRDKRCLNSSPDAYIPKYRKKEKMYGDWIKPSYVMCFKKYLKNQYRSSLNSR